MKYDFNEYSTFTRLSSSTNIDRVFFDEVIIFTTPPTDFDQNKIFPEDIVKDNHHTLLTNMGKIVIIGVESTSVAF